MKTVVLVAMSLVAFLVPKTLMAQSGIQVETHDDEMDSWTYAFTRADRGPLRSMDARGLVFDRSPCLLFVCLSGELGVVYLHGTELVGEGGTVLVQSRFDSHEASKPEPWLKVRDPSATAGIETAAAVLGVDEQAPLFEVLEGLSVAAKLSGAEAEAFLVEAGNAKRVTMRVTDQVDGETHTDVFSLAGFVDALQQVRSSCAR